MLEPESHEGRERRGPWRVARLHPFALRGSRHVRAAGPRRRGDAGRRCATVAFLAYILTSQAAWAQAESTALPPWTLVDAVEEALETHPTMHAARATQDAARSRLGIARSSWFPQLTLRASATRFAEPMLVYPIHGFTPEAIPPFSRSVVAGTLGLDFALYDGGARGSRIDAARARERHAGAATTASAQDLIQRVVSTYLHVLGREQLLQSHDRRLTALRAELSRVRQVLDTGRAARVDVLRAEAEVLRAEAERIERAAALELAERELVRLVAGGAAPRPPRALRPVALVDSLVPARDSLVAAARRANADLRATEALLEAARSEGRTARAQRWPGLDLFARAQAWSDGAAEDAAEWNAGIQLDYPLFTGGARREHVAAADAATREAEARVRVLQLEIEQRIDRARSDAEEARARTRSLRSAVTRFAEVQRIRLLALDTGTGTQTDYLDAEADFLDAQARLIEASHREIESRTALAWHTGQLDVEWLRRNLENR